MSTENYISSEHDQSFSPWKRILLYKETSALLRKISNEKTVVPKRTNENLVTLDQEISCSICYEEMIGPKKIRWTCPICRKRVTEGKSRNNFTKGIASLYKLSLKPKNQ